MPLSKTCIGFVGIAILAVLNGWHLVPMQSYAWVTMAMEDTESGSFGAALSTAIEGAEKCGLCHYVDEQSGDESDVSYWDLSPKWIAILSRTARTALSPPDAWESFHDSAFAAAARKWDVDTPPPVLTAS